MNHLLSPTLRAKGSGVVLMQHSHPIAYFSKLLGPKGKAKLIYEKEFMSIVLVV